jgi:hypothetical protein
LLVTMVSIKYTECLSAGSAASEVCVSANVGNRGSSGASTVARKRESLGQDLAMFRLCTSAVRAGALFERLNERFIDAANEQVRPIGTSQERSNQR